LCFLGPFRRIPQRYKKRSVTSILKALEHRGPLRGSDLARHLTSAGVGPATARKRIQRAMPPVHRLTRIRLPHNETFLYLASQFQSPVFWEALLAAFDTTGSAYGVAVRAIEGRGGVVEARRFDVVSGSPLAPLRGHATSATIRRALEEVGMLRSVKIPSVGECLELVTMPVARNFGSIRANALAEEILLAAVANWARDIGLVSYDKVATRGPQAVLPTMGKFGWDLSGPIYAKPFVSVRRTKPFPGFFVADVALGSRLDLPHIRYFINKCIVQDSMKNRRPFMAALIAHDFAPDALREGKKSGVLMATPAALLGTDVALALRGLVDALTNAASRIRNDPELLGQLFGRLGRIEGAAMNLRGPLFELIVAYSVGKLEPGEVDVGRLAVDPRNGETADIDVLRLVPGEAHCYECRGKLADADLRVDEVADWLERQVPRMSAWLDSTHPNRTKLFELWTTARFATEAIDYMRCRADMTKHYALQWKDGPEVRQFVERVRERRLVDALNEHFLRHPLVTRR